jgi:hypothetical protein
MKKKYVVAFPATLFLVLVISLTALVLAQPTAESFGIEDASGRPGTYVEVPVNITNVMNGPVQCIRLKVDYTDSVLNLTNINNSDLTSTWTQLQLGEDGHTMTIATAESEAAIPNGSCGSVVLLNFYVIGSPGDTSPVNMTLIELSNPEGGVGTAQARNGIFTIKSSGIDTAPPITTITFPLNGSTLGILNNSVIGSITDESALETAYLTLNDEFVTTLSKGPFNVKVNYTANATNKIEVFANDIAGNANSTRVLVNVLPNVVVVNTSTVANETIAIDAKNTTNTVIELNATIAANVSVTINANTNASALNAEPATSAYGLAQNQISLEKYIDVNVTGIDKANLTFVSLYLYYTTADLDRTGDGDAGDPGDLNEQTLKMYWFNPNTRLWMPLGPSPDADERPDYTALGGPKVIDGKRNTVEKYIKVTLNHFSTFALVAEVIPAPVTPTPTPSLEGSGGGASLPTPTPIPTSAPTATLTPTETPTLAPTITPSTTTQTPTPTPAPVPIIPMFLVLIAMAVIVIAGVIIVVLRR